MVCNPATDARQSRDQRDPSGAAVVAATVVQVHLVQPHAAALPRGRGHGAPVPALSQPHALLHLYVQVSMFMIVLGRI